MRDIRDPQAIGEMLLNRSKGRSILNAADELDRLMIRYYGETDEEVEKRFISITNGYRLIKT
jgi:hypothetical protein